MATMTTALVDRRPSAPRAVSSPQVSVHTASVPAPSTGRSAATATRSERVYRLVPTAAVLLGAERSGTVKINNYIIGTPAAAPAMGAVVAGAAMSSRLGLASGVFRNQLDVDMVKGIDARGIPPRGRRSA